MLSSSALIAGALFAKSLDERNSMRLDSWAHDHIPLYRKWGSILYAVRGDRATLAEARALWAQAERDFEPVTPGERGFLGFDRSVGSEFFYLLAKKQNDEAEQRRCVNGNCVEFWYRGRNTGGFGPAGCGCS